MPTFEPGQVVRVPFPYTDRTTRQRRPALVIAEPFAARHGEILWVMMITSAENAGWPDDLPVAEPQASSGLGTASIIRPAKIAAIDAAEAEGIGRISEPLWQAVASLILARLR